LTDRRSAQDENASPRIFSLDDFLFWRLFFPWTFFTSFPLPSSTPYGKELHRRTGVGFSADAEGRPSFSGFDFDALFDIGSLFSSRGSQNGILVDGGACSPQPSIFLIALFSVYPLCGLLEHISF